MRRQTDVLEVAAHRHRIGPGGHSSCDPLDLPAKAADLLDQVPLYS